MPITRRDLLFGSAASLVVGCNADGVIDLDAASEDDAPVGDDASVGDDAPASDAASALDAAPARDAARDAARDPVRDGTAARSDLGADPADVGRLDAGAPPDVSPPAPDVPAPRDVRATPADPFTVPEDLANFPLAVMAGDATPSGVTLWTWAGGIDALGVRVEEVVGGRTVAVPFQSLVARAAGSQAVHVEVTGLRPAARYRFAFFRLRDGGVVGRSAIGRFRAAFADTSVEPISFGGTSCTSPRFSYVGFPCLAHAASRSDLDLFLHAGDHIYADIDYTDAQGRRRPNRIGVPSVETADARTREQYRNKYRDQFADPGLRALHAAQGVYLTWDDHEVYNNWPAERIVLGLSSTDAVVRAWAQAEFARVIAANAAFFEFRAVRRSPAVPTRIWRSFRWGRTAEFFILDARSERRAREGLFLSRQQMDWLKQGLASSPAFFKFVLNPKPITNLGARIDENDDFWLHYPTARRELLTHVDGLRRGATVFLSGDVHFGAVCRVAEGSNYPNIWEVLMGPGGNGPRNNLVWERPEYRAQIPVVVNQPNYAAFQADPTTRRLEVRFRGNSGGVIPGASWSRTF